MQKLPKHIMERFLKGEHVMRHKPGVWNGIWSDMYIETTFMRYGHGPGGIIGLTLKPNTLKKWALSLHIFGQLEKDLVDLKDNCTSQKIVLFHKEESAARIASDKNDRERICFKLEQCIHPLDPEQHPAEIVNIASGALGSNDINVNNAVEIGKNQLKHFEDSLPKGFYDRLQKKVVNMSSLKKKLKISNVTIVDSKLIYTRVLGMLLNRDFDIKSLFQYELAPVPTALFTDNGEMRSTIKSKMKSILAVEHSQRFYSKLDEVFLDGCAIMWIVPWPTNGTVKDYVDNFSNFVKKHLLNSNVHLIFDRYFENSTKTLIRSRRAGVKATQRYQLNLSTQLPPQQVVLKVTESKVQLIDILCKHLAKWPFFEAHLNRLTITGQNLVPLQVEDGVATERIDLRSNHEEADVLIVQSVVKSVLTQNHKNLKVICDDTDVFILLLHFYKYYQLKANIIMEGTRQNRMVIDIGATVSKNENIVDQLLAGHAISGCDTVENIYGIGKGKILKKLNEGKKLLLLGSLDAGIDDIVKEATQFIGTCYMKEPHGSMTHIRFYVWSSITGKLKASSTPSLKTLPPTNEAFKEHVKRAHLQCVTWKSAMESTAPPLDPFQYGWSKDTDKNILLPVMLPEGKEVAPLEVIEMIKCGCGKAPICSFKCSCSAANLSCSVFCGCHGDLTCENPQTHFKLSPEETDDDLSDEDNAESD